MSGTAGDAVSDVSGHSRDDRTAAIESRHPSLSLHSPAADLRTDDLQIQACRAGNIPHVEPRRKRPPRTAMSRCAARLIACEYTAPRAASIQSHSPEIGTTCSDVATRRHTHQKPSYCRHRRAQNRYSQQRLTSEPVQNVPQSWIDNPFVIPNARAPGGGICCCDINGYRHIPPRALPSFGMTSVFSDRDFEQALLLL